MSRERRAIGSQRIRQETVQYNPHLGERFNGTEYKPKYSHQDIDRILDAGGTSVFGIPFTQEGPLVAATSFPFDAFQQLGLIAITAKLLVPGTTSTVIEARVDGTLVSTVTIAASSARGESGLIKATIKGGATLQMSTITPGSGAQDLTVIAWLLGGDGGR